MLLPAVLAETISRDQLNQLAAVMLGLVVFACVFALIERQRSRRSKHRDDAEAPPIDPPRSTPPPRYVSDSPAVAITTAPASRAGTEVVSDGLPMPFLPRTHESAPASTAGQEPAAAPSVAPAPEPPSPEPARPSAAESPEMPAAGQVPESSPPASPDEIGIILPDEPPPAGGGGTSPRP
jgi:hypothetical protein